MARGSRSRTVNFRQKIACDCQPTVHIGCCLIDDNIKPFIAYFLFVFVSAVCKHNKFNLAFLIDGSASMQTLNLSAALQYKNLIKTVIDFYKVDKDDTNVGLVVYSSLTITQFTFDTYYSKKDINEAIDSMSYPENATYTGAGLEAVQNSLFGHARPGMHNCLVAVTDGMSNDDVSLPAAHLKAMKVVTLAVGVGEFYSTEELQQIATTPSHVFQAPVYDDLHDTADKVKESLCNGKIEITEQFGVCLNMAQRVHNYVGLASCLPSSTATCLYIEWKLGTRV